jgi:hypothetical protein
MADGGMVKGIKVIDTPAQLMALIKKYPEEAKANGLSVEMVKEEVKKMARGGSVMAKGRGGMARGGEIMMAHGGVMGCAYGGMPSAMKRGGGLRLF